MGGGKKTDTVKGHQSKRRNEGGGKEKRLGEEKAQGKKIEDA